ncbi:hypothetical protein BTR23_02450 [Alkalihalophilus pseudofirmus]|nr:hypothetical protein BTR23_02450 [Alkalihalophilus pseudofirmus]
MWVCKKINENGFTLIEVILAFALFVMVVSLLPLIIKAVPVIFPPTEQPHILQVELFYNQLSMEIREANEIRVIGNSLYLTKPNDTVITIERFGTLIRRRVDGYGHDVFLRHVSDLSYKSVPNGVVVTIIDTNGSMYERRFSMVCCWR